MDDIIPMEEKEVKVLNLQSRALPGGKEDWEKSRQPSESFPHSTGMGEITQGHSVAGTKAFE